MSGKDQVPDDLSDGDLLDYEEEDETVSKEVPSEKGKDSNKKCANASLFALCFSYP